MSSGGVASQGGGEESPLVREAVGFLAEEKSRRGVEKGMHAAEAAVTKLESAARSIGSNAGSLSLTHSLTLIRSLALSHSHPFTLSLALTRSLALFLSHSLTRSLAHSLTHSLAHSLTMAPTPCDPSNWSHYPPRGSTRGTLPSHATPYTLHPTPYTLNLPI